MADAPSFGTLGLKLSQVFPPVPASAWTEAIERDLGGAAVSTLEWDLGDGLRVRPYYRREDAQARGVGPLFHHRCRWCPPERVPEDAIPVRAGVDGLAAAGEPGVRRAIDITVKAGTLLIHRSRVRQRKDLKAAGISQDWAMPVHESMNATDLLEDVRSRTQQQVIRVDQQHTRTGHFEALHCLSFHRRLRTNRHKDRCLHLTMERQQSRCACL